MAVQQGELGFSPLNHGAVDMGELLEVDCNQMKLWQKAEAKVNGKSGQEDGFGKMAEGV